MSFGSDTNYTSRDNCLIWSIEFKQGPGLYDDTYLNEAIQRKHLDVEKLSCFVTKKKNCFIVISNNKEISIHFIGNHFFLI